MELNWKIFIYHFLQILSSNSLKKCIFPYELKVAEVILLFKKAYPFDKVNYQPVRLLLPLSKVCERIIYSKIKQYIEPFLSNLLAVFHINHNTQHCNKC